MVSKMDVKVNKKVDEYKEIFSGECHTWLTSSRIKGLINQRKVIEANIARIALDSSNAHPLSPMQLKFVFQRSLSQFSYTLCTNRIEKGFYSIVNKLAESGARLLDETSSTDLNRSREIQCIKGQENPYIRFYESYADLVRHVDVAISWADHTIGHVTNAQVAQGAQYLTRNSETKSGKFINIASQGADAYSQMSIPESLANLKLTVSIVHGKARALQSTVLPQNWNNISTSDMTWTFIGKNLFQSGSIGSIAKFLNFVSITDLGAQLDNLRYGLILLRVEAIKPIDAYHQFEGDREKLIQRVLQQEKDKLLNYKDGSGPSMNEIAYRTGEEAFGSEEEGLEFNFKKAAIGLGIGLIVSFASASYVMYKLNDNQPTPTKEPNHHQLENNR